MTNINDISDLAQVLQDNPQWREIIRSILLGDELAQLPGLMAEFVQATQLNFQLVYERLDLLEGDVAALKAGQARLEEGQARLEEGQVRLETDVAGLKEGQARLETDVAGLKEGQTRLETDVSSLKEGQTRISSQLSNLVGSDYERQAARLAHRRLRQYMNVHDAKIFYSITTPDRMDIPELMDQAIENGAITHEEVEDLEQTDLILMGRTPDRNDVYVLAEISVTVDQNDILRAKRRATILERAASAPARAAVIGESISEPALELAAREDVVFLQAAGRRTQIVEVPPPAGTDA